MPCTRPPPTTNTGPIAGRGRCRKRPAAGRLSSSQRSIGVNISPCFSPQPDQHRIATQMLTQQSRCFDLSALSTSIRSLAQGMPECSVCTCMLVCVFYAHFSTRDRGCSVHPAFPAPSLRDSIDARLGRFAPRERSCVCVCVNRRMGGAKRYPSMPVRVAMGIASLHPSYRNSSAGNS